MLRRKTILLFTSLILFCLSLGFVAGFFSYPSIINWQLQRQYQITQQRFLNKQAPDICAQTVDGTLWSLQAQQGKVVLINFWATWCEPCIQELPEMKALYAKYKDRSDFIMIGVSLDESKNILIEFCEKHQIEWQQIYDSDKQAANSFARAFNVQSIPSAWLIDRNGKIAAFNLRSDELETRLNQLLNIQVKLMSTYPASGGEGEVSRRVEARQTIPADHSAA